MRLRSYVIAAGAACLCLSAAFAQEGPIAARQALMKANGQAAGALGAIAKGEKPYDAATVRSALTTISTDMKAFPDQFPAGSDTGKTKALPAIWQNPDGFRALSAKLASEAEALVATLPADRAGVGAALGRLGPICSECHKTYRAPAN
ncbi:cytochrome c [Neorhizobium sp. CSC1952]|uniref:Cytochrome c556 n=1 Tax=Xaviernesmea oryzae TaxID=464029 RepID=A0A1X7F8V2_9HYPH|nr:MULTISPECIES: cytochrome c [Rhizobium/Agrobacterium group]WJR67720.1 cytochrome c [Rhizobium sp. CSC1952]SMF48238.1 Cytochrome c556 [Xaviernesmea oryzae]